jgi:hypothetical protein
MEFSKQTQDKHVKDMQAELNNLSDEMRFKNDKIQDMEANLHMLREKLQSKEDELYSLKQHECRDDTNEFTEVKSKQKSKIRSMPHVVIIGTSNTRGINPSKLSSQFSAERLEALTFYDTLSAFRGLKEAPDIIIFHSLTKELQVKGNEECVNFMRELVNEINEVFVNTKIIISLPTPRADKEALNNKAQMLNLLIKEEFHDERSVV